MFWKWDVDMEYLGRFKMTLSSHMGDVILQVKPKSEKHMKN